MLFNDTIVAVSTPPGMGAISIIRITGNDSFKIAEKMFSGKSKLSSAQTHTIHFGKIVDPDKNEIIDTVLISVFRSPKSYTGYDIVEINCHGGYINNELILELIIKNGARFAEPGEFTKLAFLNGKIDLTQVEAVADIINSKTRKAQRSSIAQLLGGLSKEILQLKKQLINTASLLELDIDFADEHLLTIETKKIINDIQIATKSIGKLLSTYQQGHLLREGAKISIIGKPNVGKSSLLNALLKKNRAIVSEIPGTTRDYLEEVIDINGIPFTFIDTAGLRHTENLIEQTGINSTKDQIRISDLVLLMLDASNPLDENDQKVFDIVNEYHKTDTDKKIIIIKNKTDIGNVVEENYFEFLNCQEVSISAKKLTGLEDLKETIQNTFNTIVSDDFIMISNLRQKESLQKSLDYLNHAVDGLNNNMSFEFVSLDIRGAINGMSEFLGEVTNEDILNNIFEHFCIGK